MEQGGLDSWFQQLPLGALTDIDVVAVIVIIGWLVASGRWQPRSTVDRMEKRYQRELEDLGHDRDEWRAAHRISEQARVEEREHNRALVEDLGATVTRFLAGFRRAADEVGASREGDHS